MVDPNWKNLKTQKNIKPSLLVTVDEVETGLKSLGGHKTSYYYNQK